MAKRRARNRSHEILDPEVAAPLRALQTELSRLKSPSDDARNPDVVAARVLDALRHLGEALAPLTASTESPVEAPSPAGGPVLAFRRGQSEEGPGERQPRAARVLVVEPEPSVNDYIESVLEDAGFAVVSIPQIEAAVERARLEPPDIVALDQLVLRHGAEENWLVRFKTDSALSRIPVVLVRAPGDEEPPHPFGIAAMVTKPIDPDELTSALRRVTIESAAPPEPETPSISPDRRVVRG
jgi:CheY-like chemotaxis protein